jgi:CHAT domain-containing protein/Flp pilus assembly protein TadD
MPSRSAPHRRVASSLLLAGLAGLGMLLCGAKEPEPSVGPALTDGLTLERDLRKGEIHSYPVELQTGQFLRVAIQEIGVDLAVRLFDPAGAEVTGVDGVVPGGSEEDLVTVAAANGTYRVEVRTESRHFAQGRYRLRVEGPRPAGGDDALRAEAVKASWIGSDPAKDDAGLQRTIASLERALPLWRRLEEPQQSAQTLYLLGHFHSPRPEDPEPAVQDYLRAAAAWAGHTSPETKDWQARFLNAAGMILARLGRSEEARRHYEEALAALRGSGNPGTEASSLNNLALIDIDRGELQSATAELAEALQKARGAGDRTTEAKALNNLGYAYDQLAERQKALQYYQQVLDLARASSQRPLEALALNNLGVAYSSLGDHEAALKHYHQALAVIQTLSGHPNEEKTLINLGQTLVHTGGYEEARKYFLQALASTSDPEIRMSVFLSQAYLLVALKQPAQAVEPARQALQLARGFPDREASALCALGIAHREAGDLPAAREELARALALVHSLQDRSREAEIGVSLAKAERDAGDQRAARSQARASVDLLESLRTKVFDQRLRTSFLATKQTFYEVYIDTLMPRGMAAAAAAEDVAAALQVSERARARSLLDILTESGTDVRAGGDPALAEREQRLHDQLNSLDSYRFKLLGEEKPDRKKLGETERQLEEALDAYRKAQADLQASSPGYAALTQPQPLSVAEIRTQVLDGRALLLEYALGEKRSFLWVVTPEEVASFELPERARIEPLARRYYELLTARNQQPPAESLAGRKRRIGKADAAAGRAGAELSHLLLAPAARLLGDRPLLVVADGALQYVPFAALPIPASSAPLVTRHEVVSLPSASALAALRRQVRNRPQAAKTLAVFADPVFQATDERLTHSLQGPKQLSLAARRDGGWSPGDPRQEGEAGLTSFGRLPSSAKEARTISALVPPGKLFLATGFAATRAKALNPELAQFRNLHFATHGVLDSRHPELSKLVLSLYDEHGRAQDGFLPLNDIYNLHLNADLVVLSACRTALGQDIRGEGLVGLTRGFMYAGAARVLASLWSVEDRATAELMGELYRGMLRRGLSPAAALRRAQLAMLKSPIHRAPFYWAGFSLQGEWR